MKRSVRRPPDRTSPRRGRGLAAAGGEASLAFLGLRDLLNLIPAGALIKDLENRILLSNREAAAALGRTPEDVEGRRVEELCPAEAAVYQRNDLEVVLSGRPKLGAVEPEPRPDGGQDWVRVDKIPVRAPSGKIVGLAVFVAHVDGAAREQAIIREAYDELERVLASISDCLWSGEADENGHFTFTYVSPVAERFSGRPVTPLAEAARHWMASIEPADVASVLASFGSLLKGERTHTEHEYRLRRPDGALRWLRDSITARRMPDGRIRLDGILTDVSVRKKAEEETAERGRLLALLSDLTRLTLEAASFGEIRQELTDRLRGLFGADRCFITLRDDEGRNRPAASSGTFAPGFSRAVVEPDEPTLTSSAIAAGRPIAAEDVLRSPHVSRRLARYLRSRSVLAAPLFAGDRGLGAILVGFTDPRTFSPRDLDFAALVAGHVALAIDKTRLLEAERNRAEQLARHNSLMTGLVRVASRIEGAAGPEAVLAGIGAELRGLGIHCMVGMRDGDGHLEVRYLCIEDRFTHRGARPPGKPVTGLRIPEAAFPDLASMFGDRFPVHVPDLRPLLARLRKNRTTAPLARALGRAPDALGGAISVPLVAAEEVIGVLWLWGDGIQRSDIPAATLFGSQVSGALERGRLYAEIQRLVITDPLTGVYNRRGLDEVGRRELERAIRFRKPIFALLVDIDRFKQVNDRYGHAAGDEALRVVAARCKETVREIDVVARYGGDELVVLLVESDLPSARRVAERLRKAVEQAPVATSAGDVRVTVSIGIASTTRATREIDRLVDRADQAMYAAKQRGRNRVELG